MSVQISDQTRLANHVMWLFMLISHLKTDMHMHYDVAFLHLCCFLMRICNLSVLVFTDMIFLCQISFLDLCLIQQVLVERPLKYSLLLFSFFEFPIPNNVVFIGEVGLGGELRTVSIIG